MTIRFRLLAGMTLAAVLAWAPVGAGRAPTATADTAMVTMDDDTALLQAQSIGQPVEAMADRTEFSQTFANADGTFNYEVSPVQQRVQFADGSWADVDTTLQLQAGGTIMPAVSPVATVLSGGGTAPALQVTQDDADGTGSLGLSWAGGPLPAPALSGDTATYAGVLPGVDLDVTATDQGADATLVVGSAQAAGNPALAQVGFGLSATGLSLAADVAGNVTATSPAGDPEIDVQQALMWDSAGDGSDAGGPGAAVQESVAAVTLNGGTLTIVPNESMLTSAITVFPVFIALKVTRREPSDTVHGPRNGWLDVGRDNAGGTWGNWEPRRKPYSNQPKQPAAPVGPYCRDDGNGNCLSDLTGFTPKGEHRTYFNFTIPSRIWDATQSTISAKLFTNDIWTWSCSVKTNVELWLTNRANKGIRWDNQPSERQKQDTQSMAHGNPHGPCAADAVAFDATPAVKSAASSHWRSFTLELRASDADESAFNVNARKIFSVGRTSDPKLVIHYDHAPGRPTATKTLDGSRSVGCSSSSGIFITTTTPTLEDKISDPDAIYNDAGNIHSVFQWARVGGSPSGQPNSLSEKSGSTFWTTIPASANLPDGTYWWNAWGEDSTGIKGPHSAPCEFTIDTSAPATPTITPSTNYQDGAPVGTVQTFTFSDLGNRDATDHVNDVVGYRYGFTNPPVNVARANHEGGTAQVRITPVALGQQMLYVQAIDRAGNLSGDTAADPPAQFVIRAGRAPLGGLIAYWPLDEGSGTRAADATGNGHDATLSGGASWAAGPTPGSSALSLDGATGQAFSGLPALGNTFSFTVSARVWMPSVSTCADPPLNVCTLGPPAGHRTILSQDGTTVSGFFLQKGGDCDCWAFSMPANDSTNPAPSRAEAKSVPVRTETWVQLTGVFDAINDQASIYVDGQRASSVSNVPIWSGPALGPIRIGRTLYNGEARDWWQGRIADVCTFWGALNDAQVASLYTDGCTGAGAQPAALPVGPQGW